ncbi:PDZ domain-containing protein, partial [bacterium]|nr:PDZ domain-containing protein [bacterium]
MRTLTSRGLARALLLLAASLPALASADGPSGSPPSPAQNPPAAVSSPTTPQPYLWKSTNLERSKRVVEEVIEKLRTLHVDREKLTDEKCREAAIEALRDHVGGRGNGFHLLEGKPRDDLRHALEPGRVREGDLDRCYQVLDTLLWDEKKGPRSPEEAWTLTDVLARGAIAATGDPFTQFIDQRMLARLAALSLFGDHVKGYGLKLVDGVKIVDAHGVCTIDHIFHGYDAQEEGLQEGDTIVEIDGRPVTLMTRDEIYRRVNGDTKIRLRIFREGFSRGHDVDLEARVPSSPNVVSELLPGGVGYVRIDTFVSQTGDEVDSALKQLEKQGLRSLVLDLRDNPGGSVAACMSVASIFLGGGKIVALTESAARNGGVEGLVPSKLVTVADPATRPAWPMIVLVNGGSSSASEMLAAALRDVRTNAPTRVLGTKTWGKRVGQSPVYVASANGERFILMSTFRYLTEKENEKARKEQAPRKVLPDIDLPPAPLTPAEQEEVLRLRGEGAFERYVRIHGAPTAEILLALAKDDEGKVERYPGFDAWVRTLDTTLSHDVLRRELRGELRSWAQLEKGRIFRADLRDDVQLRRAQELLAEQPAPPQPPAPPPAQQPPAQQPAVAPAPPAP